MACRFPNKVKSFWSISDSTFKLSTLAAVVPSVAIATYIIVLNVDRVTRIVLGLKAWNVVRLMQWLLKQTSIYGRRASHIFSSPRKRKPATQMELGNVYVDVDVKIENAS